MLASPRCVLGDKIESRIGIGAEYSLLRHKQARLAVQPALRDTRVAAANAFKNERDKFRHLVTRGILTQQQTQALQHRFRLATLLLFA